MGQTKKGHLDESNQTKDLNRRRRKTANESTWKEVKGRQNCPHKVPVARKLVKNGQQERKQVSRVSLSARKSDISTHSAEASPTSNKRKLESSEKRLSKNVPETGGSSSLFANGAGNLVNKRRKGAFKPSVIMPLAFSTVIHFIIYLFQIRFLFKLHLNWCRRFVRE